MLRLREPDRPAGPRPGAEVSRGRGAATLAAFRREQPFGWQERGGPPACGDGRRATDRMLAARDFASPPGDPALCVPPLTPRRPRPGGRGRARLRRGGGGARAVRRSRPQPMRRPRTAAEAVFMVTDAADWPQELYSRASASTRSVPRTSPQIPVRAGEGREAPRSRGTGGPPISRPRGRMPARSNNRSRGPFALHSPGRPHRRGAHARVHERRGARAHARDRRDVVLVALAPGAVAQGRDLRQRPAAEGAAPRLRPGRDPRAGRAGGPGVPHRRAHLLPQRRSRPGAGRGAGDARSGRSPSGARTRPRGATRRACWPTASWSAQRSARRPRRSPARRARSRTSAWPRRRPTCSTTWPC